MIKKLILFILLSLCIVFQASAWNPMIMTSGTSAVAETPPDWVISETGTQVWGTTCSVTLNVAAGSNSAFVFFAVWSSGAETVSTITFDNGGDHGGAMTSAGDATIDTRKTQMWYYANSDWHETGNKIFLLTLNGAAEQACWGAQIDGVDLSDPLDNVATNTADDANPSTIIFTLDPVDTNTLIISGAMVSDVDDFLTVSGTGQTRDADSLVGQGALSVAGGYEDNVSGDSDTHTWNSASTPEDLAGIIMSLNPTP